VAGDRLCAIHQPNLFPRLATLGKLFTADVWVILDDVQFARRDYQHRCRVATLSEPGEPRWLTIPVHLPSGRATLIQDVRLADPDRAGLRVARMISQYYRRSPHWDTLAGPLQEILDVFERTDRLAEITEASTRALLSMLGWPGQIRRSSDLPACAGRTERLADRTQAAGCATYLCGTSGARYLQTPLFTGRGLIVQYFTLPPPGNAPAWHADRRLASLQALMTIGPDALADLLQANADSLRNTGSGSQATQISQ
jgi:hypothetical protein